MSVELTEEEAIVLTAFHVKKPIEQEEDSWHNEDEFIDLGYTPTRVNQLIVKLQSKNLLQHSDQLRIFLDQKTFKPKRHNVRVYAMTDDAYKALNELEPVELEYHAPRTGLFNEEMFGEVFEGGISLEDSLSFLNDIRS